MHSGIRRIVEGVDSNREGMPDTTFLHQAEFSDIFADSIYDQPLSDVEGVDNVFRNQPAR